MKQVMAKGMERSQPKGLKRKMRMCKIVSCVYWQRGATAERRKTRATSICNAEFNTTQSYICALCYICALYVAQCQS